MKTLRTCGWAVIFTVTLLLAACATSTKVATTDTLSGPDATMVQLEEQKQLLESRENAVVINEAWLDELKMRLDRREADLDRRANALAINQAWLNERETRLAQQTPDLTRRGDMLAFRQAWLDETNQHSGNYVNLAGADASTATAVSSQSIADTSRTKIVGGHCYATVVFPAEYKTVAVTKPIEVPKGENLPVLYQTVTEKVKVTDEQMRWEEVLCEDRMTSCRVSEIQRALYRGGYNPGPIDGIIGQQTMRAVNDFQKDYNLTVANQLTIETVRALDANF
jgi:hypothetical protein